MSSTCIETHRSLMEYRRKMLTWLNRVCRLCFCSPASTSQHNLRPARNTSVRSDFLGEKHHSVMLRKNGQWLNNLLAADLDSHCGCCGVYTSQLKSEVQVLRESSSYETWNQLRNAVKDEIQNSKRIIKEKLADQTRVIFKYPVNKVSTNFNDNQQSNNCYSPHQRLPIQNAQIILSQQECRGEKQLGDICTMILVLLSIGILVLLTVFLLKEAIAMKMVRIEMHNKGTEILERLNTSCNVTS
eukprot:TRINITY_DN10098_c0_g1_i8.p1 TRINITY_DN10098_c0_g1~~TRINITY_DN10098_c0_g1_i8.p1  ORF type:complete len:243 (+),score=5.12 TRINITY_DN10098_c0_g1_i8:117-845(+)